MLNQHDSQIQIVPQFHPVAQVNLLQNPGHKTVKFFPGHHVLLPASLVKLQDPPSCNVHCCKINLRPGKPYVFLLLDIQLFVKADCQLHLSFYPAIRNRGHGGPDKKSFFHS